MFATKVTGYSCLGTALPRKLYDKLLLKSLFKTHTIINFISRSHSLDSRNPTETLNMKTQNIEFVNENKNGRNVARPRERGGKERKHWIRVLRQCVFGITLH